MTNFRYFAGETLLTNVARRGEGGVLAGIDPANPPVYLKGMGWVGYVNVERSIVYKSNPSKHECDARCINATGRTMQCECSCGGKNHGKGAFNCEAVQ